MKIEIKDAKKSEESIKKLEDLVESLKYYLNNMKIKDTNLQFAKNIVYDLDYILRNDIRELKNNLKSSMTEEEKNKRFENFSKSNVSNKNITTMGRLLNIKKSIIENTLKKVGSKNER